MTNEIIRYNEPLNNTEISFLQNKVAEERKLYYKVYSILMVMCFIVPFAGAWYQAAEGAEAAFSLVRYFGFTIFLLSVCSSAVYLSYRYYLRKVLQDLKLNTKTVELSHITRKQYMPQNNSYHFYIDSPNRLSIQVEQEDFYRMDEGDEVSIEYTTNAKLFLGYF